MPNGDVLRRALGLAGRLLIVVRDSSMNSRLVQYNPTPTAVSPRRALFQKYYQQNELRQWIEEMLGEEPVAAAGNLPCLPHSPKAGGGEDLFRYDAIQCLSRVASTAD
jgi:hypothetical protein